MASRTSITLDDDLSSNMTLRFVRCSRVLLVLGAVLSVSPALQAQQSQSVVSSNKEQDLRQTVSRALNSLGIFYFEKQQYAKAIETLEAALRYAPENAGIRVNLSMVYLEQKQFEKVIATLDSDPKSTYHDQRSLTAMAVSNFVLGRYDQAVLFYKRLSQMLPSDQGLLLTLAGAHHLNNETQASQEILQKLPQDDKTRGQYHAVLGDAYRYRAKGLEAVGEYEKARSLAPDLPGVNYQLGVLQSELHDYNKAVEAFQRELTVDPNSADAHYSLGAYYLGFGNDPEQARRHFEKTLQLRPTHLGGYLGLIKIYISDGRSEEALRLADQAAGLANGNEEFHYLRARALSLLGKKEEAEKEMKTFERMREKKDLP
jgi:tetratricopeptide (TPR) repeat protein